MSQWIRIKIETFQSKPVSISIKLSESKTVYLGIIPKPLPDIKAYIKIH
ncbi:MAG: hypothetical protein ACI978_000050 [Oleispira sp.]|jgi:hypothetical protein